MARGQRDWGEYSSQELVDKNLDNAELAARLGSPALLDRRGTVIYHDLFNDTITRWYVYTPGAQRICLTHRMAFLGSYSLVFHDDTDPASNPAISIVLPYVTVTPVGVEGVWNFTNVNEACTLVIMSYKAGVIHEFYMKYDAAAQTITLHLADGSYTVVQTGLKIQTDGNTWTSIKLVGDPVTGYYVRARFQNLIFDLSAYQSYSYGTSLGDALSVGFSGRSTDTTARDIYLGLSLVTQNE